MRRDGSKGVEHSSPPFFICTLMVLLAGLIGYKKRRPSQRALKGRFARAGGRLRGGSCQRARGDLNPQLTVLETVGLPIGPRARVWVSTGLR